MHLEAAGLAFGNRLLASDPLGYVDFRSPAQGLALVVADCGEPQPETALRGTLCFILRPGIERSITISRGTNWLVPREPAPVVAGQVLSESAHSSPHEAAPLMGKHVGIRLAGIMRTLPNGHA